MTAPLASGPYRIGQIEAGRQLVYDRMPDFEGAVALVTARRA